MKAIKDVQIPVTEKKEKPFSILVRDLDKELWDKARDKAWDEGRLSMNKLIAGVVTKWLQDWVDGRIKTPKGGK